MENRGEYMKSKRSHKCPTCGKNTDDVHFYKDGSSLYVHSVKILSKPYPHRRILNACAVNRLHEGVTPKQGNLPIF